MKGYVASGYIHCIVYNTSYKCVVGGTGDIVNLRRSFQCFIMLMVHEQFKVDKST